MQQKPSSVCYLLVPLHLFLLVWNGKSVLSFSHISVLVCSLLTGFSELTELLIFSDS